MHSPSRANSSLRGCCPTSTGISAVIDPHGRVTARSEGDGPEIVTAELQRSSAVTPYQVIGDAGAALVCLGLAAFALVGRAHEPALSGGST